ncbi:P-loop containing nucleoside triphosphate hydrolase protein [Neolentinus lepideus HHB14362 ss-1]|uniref:p-loop containing nucleoside triphosphate hydrolase protein n=1 Tax=Neolentinus lepideus HHB14362 ss-1 TaxID=1314782 RepID=A0A165VVF5_9AGAM|nr:P-loop containing nucleoside triphosphate hydrolase protein [Neolentinus lepideus HHB14362 ss-1]
MGRNKHTKKINVPTKSKLKKDPGIPRLPDLKVRNAEKERIRLSPTLQRNDSDTPMASEPTLSSLAQLAASIGDDDPSTQDPSSSTIKTKEQLRRHYIRALHKVVDQSDIVVLVLDARDPEGCRSRLVEEEVRRRESEGKKLMFVLNKIDLVPRENAQQWLRYLRHTTPTLPFRSASQNQRTNLSSATAPALLRLLKAYKPSASQSLTVGVVGYPNAGKSSLINSLKRSKACSVAAQPGHTKELQHVQLERGLKIIDSPGVIFDDDDWDNNGKGSKKGSVLLRNVVKVEDIEDPIAVVEEIVARTDSETLQKIYNLPQYTSTLEFLTMLAMTTGRLLKGGTPDLLGTARQVLTDWNHQKIPYFSTPPSVHPSSIPTQVEEGVIAPGAEDVGQAKIVTEFAPAFNIEGLFGQADRGAFEDAEMRDGDGEVEGERMDQDQDGMDEQEQEHPRKRPRSPSLDRATSMVDSDTDIVQRPPKRMRKSRETVDDNHAMMAKRNPLSRRVLKKEAKRSKRAANKALGRTGSAMEVELEGTFMVGPGASS